MTHAPQLCCNAAVLLNIFAGFWLRTCQSLSQMTRTMMLPFRHFKQIKNGDKQYYLSEVCSLLVFLLVSGAISGTEISPLHQILD